MSDNRHLPLARHSQGEAKMPSTEAIGEAVKMVIAGNTEEGAKYLRTALEKKLIACDKLEAGQGLLAKIDGVVSYVQMRIKTGEKAWEGKVIDPSEYKTFQDAVAREAHAILKDMLGKVGIVYNYAINDESNLVRGYSTEDGKTPDEAAVKAFDDLFNAWLAENEMRNKEGYIYHTDGNGDIRQVEDEKGRKIPDKVNPQELEERIADKETGFAQSVRKDKDINFSVKQRDYPEPSKAAEAGDNENVTRGAGG